MVESGELVLDIGCGNDPQGTVNVDRKVPENAGYIKNFVLADIRYLPFKDHVFDQVRTSLLFWYEGCLVKSENEKRTAYGHSNIEPGEILKEIVRVAKRGRTDFRLYSE